MENFLFCRFSLWWGWSQLSLNLLSKSHYNIRVIYQRKFLILQFYILWENSSLFDWWHKKLSRIIFKIQFNFLMISITRIFEIFSNFKNITILSNEQLNRFQEKKSFKAAIWIKIKITIILKNFWYQPILANDCQSSQKLNHQDQLRNKRTWQR